MNPIIQLVRHFARLYGNLVEVSRDATHAVLQAGKRSDNFRFRLRHEDAAQAMLVPPEYAAKAYPELVEQYRKAAGK